MVANRTSEMLSDTRLTNEARWNRRWLFHLVVWLSVLNAGVVSGLLHQAGVFGPLQALAGESATAGYLFGGLSWLCGFAVIFSLFVAVDSRYGGRLPAIDPPEHFGTLFSVFVVVGWLFGWVGLLALSVPATATDVGQDTQLLAFLAPGLRWLYGNAVVVGSGLFVVRQFVADEQQAEEETPQSSAGAASGR